MIFSRDCQSGKMCAISPLVSDAAFRHLFVAVTFADHDGTNFKTGNDRMSVLLNRNSRFIERTNAELDKLGITQTVRRIKNRPSERRFVLSEQIASCADELYSMLNQSSEPTHMSVVTPEPSLTTVENDWQPTNRASRTDTHVGEPLFLTETAVKPLPSGMGI